MRNGVCFVIELIVYPKPKVKELLSYSPFCAKAEFFLKISGLEHKITEFVGDPGKFPNGKLPTIKDGNEVVPDSYLIEKYLINKYELTIDDHLSKQDKAAGYAMVKMLEDYLYWCVVHERWLIDENWDKVKNKYFKAIPSIIRPIVFTMVRRKIRKDCYSQGIGRHTVENIYMFANQALEAFSNFLGDRYFLLGEKISSYDAAGYGFISNIVYCDLNPKIQIESSKYPNLEAYCARLSTYL